MSKKIENLFEEIFYLLLNSGRLIIPPQDIITNWRTILIDWVNDDSSILFVRKGSETRGQRLQLFD